MVVDWERMERYSRWRRHLHWTSFPDDVSATIVAHLCAEDVLSLAEALVPRAETTPQKVPNYLRHWWMRCWVWKEFRRHVSSTLSDRLLHDTRECTSTLLFMDWSCFSPSPPEPVAVFRWVEKRALVEFRDDILLRRMNFNADKGLPTVRLSAHQNLRWAASDVLHPVPFHVSTCSLIPPSFLPLMSCEGTEYCL